MAYHGPHWAEEEKLATRKWVYSVLEHAVYRGQGEDGRPVIKQWNPTQKTVNNVIDAMTSIIHLEGKIDPPYMLDTGESARDYVPCVNGLLDSITRELHPATPNYFGTVAVPFDYDPLADDLFDWLDFLRSIWPMVSGVEADEITTLQEWFGYILSGRTDLQKILFMRGPKRSGKGTIARVLTALVGKGNTAGPTLGSLATNFGLQPLIGKSIAVIGDARLGRGHQSEIIEKLLSISGEDALTVDMKYKESWCGTLSVRFTMLSNELPKFGDASGAIASRLLILTMIKSFLGEEDTQLYNRLIAKLPAILNWSLDGLDRLRERGQFKMPAASANAVQQLEELTSPVSAFVRAACEVGQAHSVPFDTIYSEWVAWCEKEKRRPTNKAAFSSDMTAAFPHLVMSRPRDAEGKPGPRKWEGIALSADWLKEQRVEGARRAEARRIDELGFADHDGDN
jgi:putative DNA primase/helicase